MASRARSKEVPPLRWLVGMELAGHREAAGLSMTDVARRTGISKPKLGQMETGRQTQSPTDIVVLLSEYKVDREVIDSLVTLTERSGEAAWASGSAHAVPNWFRIYLGLERIAIGAFTFEPLLVPGMLQIASYARTVTGQSLFVRTPDVGRVVDLRMARAARLCDDANPLAYHAVTTETALRTKITDPDTHQAQLDHLVDIGQRPNVTIQVLRAEDGYHDAHRGHFVLLGFVEVGALAYTETIDNALYIQDPHQVSHFALVADQLKKLALDPDHSLELISTVKPIR